MKPQGRLDPRSMLVIFVRTISRLLYLLVLFFILQFTGGEGDRMEFVVAALAMFGVVGSLYEWWTVRYGIVGDTLVFERVGLFRQEKTVPLERIQSVHIERTLIHRLLGLAKLKVDTATAGASAEIELDSLSLTAAEAFRVQLMAGTGHHPEMEVRAPVLWKATARELFLTGVTSNQWYVIVGGILSMAPFMRGGQEGLFRRVGQQAISPWLWMAIIAGLFLLGWMISMARAYIQFYGFQISQSEGRLHREYGLFNTRKNSVPIRRVQSMTWRTTWLKRRVGFWQVNAETAGSMKIKDDPAQNGLLCPYVEDRQLRVFTNVVFTDLDWSSVRWQPADRRSVLPAFTNSLVSWGIIAVPLGIWQPWLAWQVGVLAILLAFLSAVLDVRSFKVGFGGRYGFVQRGWMSTSLTIVPLDKVQSIRWEQGPIERRAGVAALHLEVPGSVSLHVPYLPAGQLNEIGEVATQWISRTGSWAPDGV